MYIYPLQFLFMKKQTKFARNSLNCFFYYNKMITRVDNIEYCKLNELEDHLEDYDSVVLYLQCYNNINDSKDIYEFRTDRSKIYVASKTVVKMVIHDINSMNVNELIEDTINELNTRLKFIYFCEF